MARMVIEYTIQEENDVGVENFKDGKMFVQFSFDDHPDVTADKMKDALINVMNKNKDYVLNISFIAKFEGVTMAEGAMYKEGEGRWINPQSETIH
jgi:predicted Zn-dependent protease with MMP-like domain